jgi:recombinational DNA repair ATPase RecF
MTPKERRAFASGYRFALRKARRELDAMAQRLDDELAELDERMRAAREQMAQQLNAEIGGLMDERRTRNEYYRLRAVEHAIDIERDVNTLLN